MSNNLSLSATSSAPAVANGQYSQMPLVQRGRRYKGAIAENLERLEWFGVLLCREDGHTKWWQFAELQQSA